MMFAPHTKAASEHSNHIITELDKSKRLRNSINPKP